MKFQETFNQYDEQFNPKPIVKTAFQKAMEQNRFDLYVEQELPPPVGGDEPPPAGEMDTGAPAEADPQVGTEIEEPKLEDKPYAWMGYIAYKALMTDPSDLNENSTFEALTQEIGDIVDKSDITTPEMGLKVLIAINKIIDEYDVPRSANI